MTRVRWNTARTGLAASVLLLALFSGGTFLASESDSRADAGEDAKEQKSNASLSVYMRAAKPDGSSAAKVYTNEALRKLYGTLPPEEVPEGEGYTTDDLVSRYGDPSTDPAEDAETTDAPARTSDAPPEPAADPLAELLNEQKREVAREDRVQAAEAEVAAAQQKLDDLKVQLLATRNPFSARPKLSDEERELRATSGETAEERFERTEAAVAEAEAELAAAQQKLAQAKTGN